jgi:hypothetical protein
MNGDDVMYTNIKLFHNGALSICKESTPYQTQYTLVIKTDEVTHEILQLTERGMELLKELVNEVTYDQYQSEGGE